MSTGTIDEHRPPPVLGQSRRMSLVESIANVCVGYAIAVLTQMIVFPWFGLHTTLAENLQIGVLFTVLCRARHKMVYAERRIIRSCDGFFATSI